MGSNSVVVRRTACATTHGTGCIADVLLHMPCSECGERVDEWIHWRRYDDDVEHPSAFWYSLSSRRTRFGDYDWWFFFCSSCRRRDTSLKGWYVNADGGRSSDGDTDRSEDLDDVQHPRALPYSDRVECERKSQRRAHGAKRMRVGETCARGRSLKATHKNNEGRRGDYNLRDASKS